MTIPSVTPTSHAAAADGLVAAYGFEEGTVPFIPPPAAFAVVVPGATLTFYVNGEVVGSKATTAPIDVTTGVLRIGSNNVWSGENFPGIIDEVRIYNRALSPAEIQADMNTPVGGAGQPPPPPDTTAPTVTLTSPAPDSVLTGNVSLTAQASDNVGVTSVQFLVDGVPVNAPVTAPPYATFWNAASVADGAHSLTARARDAAGNVAVSAAVIVSTANTTTAVFPLKLAPGQRFLVDQHDVPFLIHGDTPWSLIANLTAEEAELFLEDRRQKGFNAIIVNLLEHHFSPEAPRNVYGDAPFTVPGDFATPNEAYFAHADVVLQKAAAKGIVVFLTPAYLGYNGGHEGWYQELIANGSASLSRTARSSVIATRTIRTSSGSLAGTSIRRGRRWSTRLSMASRCTTRCTWSPRTSIKGARR